MGGQELIAVEAKDNVGTITIDLRDGVAVLSLLGEHDINTADTLSEAIHEHAGIGVVVSTADAEFIDSSIVRVLFEGDRRLLACGRRLILHTGSSATLETVFELCGLRTQLLCSESLEEAVEFARQYYTDSA